MSNEADKAAVLAATEAFYAALQAMFGGDPQPLAEVYSHAGDVTYLGPDGRIEIGWAAVAANWQHQADMKLGGEVKPHGPIHVVMGGDVALSQATVAGWNIGPDGTRQEISLRETNVFRKEDGAWKMISKHADALPILKR